MSFCSKCGAKLNDGDLFCHNCGAQVDAKPQQEKYYGDIDNFPTKKAPVTINNSNVSHPLAKAGLIVSIIGLALMGLFFVTLGFAYGEQSTDLLLISTLSLLFGIVGCVVSLGLAIPGFILTKKRGYAKGVAIAALILAIICVVLFLACYIYSEYITIINN